METIADRAVAWLRRAAVYLKTLLKWVVLGLVIGAFCGVIGSAFHIGVHHATELRAEQPWLLWCLPVAGLAIVGFYKLTKVEGQGTNNVIEEVHHGKGLPFFLLGHLIAKKKPRIAHPEWLILPGALLPMAFAAVCGGLTGLLCLLVNR